MVAMSVYPGLGLNSAQWTGSGTDYVVKTNSGVYYIVFIDGGSDVSFSKSENGGLTWSQPTAIFTGTATHLAVWYDRWSGIAGGLIHCAYSESGTHDTLYRTVNTENADALSTQTVIFAGASAVAGAGHLSVTRARGGNVYCKTCIDAGVEGGFFRLPNANVPNGAWDAARTINEALAASDQMILIPGWAADDQDIMAFFWDASADEISRQLYDDSANSWAETSIAASMVELAPATGWPDFAAAVDITNSRNLLVAWTQADLANADLRCWHVTEATITEVTNVVLNSSDDQGLCAIGIDTDTQDWYVFYGGITGGTETFPTAMGLYYKVSTDDGATWGAEQKLTTPITAITNFRAAIRMIFATPRFNTDFLVAWADNESFDRLLVSFPVPRTRRATYQLGIG